MGNFQVERFLYINGMKKYMDSMIKKAEYGLYIPDINPQGVVSIIREPKNKKELSFACKFYELVDDVSKSKNLLSDKTVINFDNSMFKKYVVSFVNLYILLRTNALEHLGEIDFNSAEEIKRIEDVLKSVVNEYASSTDCDEYKNLCSEAGIIMLYHKQDFIDYIVAKVKDLPIVSGSGIYYNVNHVMIDKRVREVTSLTEYVASKCLFSLYFFNSKKVSGDLSITESNLDNAETFVDHFRSYISKVKNERKKD